MCLIALLRYEHEIENTPSDGLLDSEIATYTDQVCLVLNNEYVIPLGRKYIRKNPRGGSTAFNYFEELLEMISAKKYIGR